MPTLHAAIIQTTKVARLASNAVPIEIIIGVNRAQMAWLLARLTKVNPSTLIMMTTTNVLRPATMGVISDTIQSEMPVSFAVNGLEIAIAAESRKIIRHATL